LFGLDRWLDVRCRECGVSVLAGFDRRSRYENEILRLFLNQTRSWSLEFFYFGWVGVLDSIDLRGSSQE
jgi:hypothetical protein